MAHSERDPLSGPGALKHPAVWETRVQSLCQGRSPAGGHGCPLRCLAWRIAGTEEPGGLQSTGWQSQARLKISHFCWLCRAFLWVGASLGSFREVAHGQFPREHTETWGPLVLRSVFTQTSSAACEVSALDTCRASCSLAGTELERTGHSHRSPALSYLGCGSLLVAQSCPTLLQPHGL